MADWNPALYSRFEDERTRPARDLLARCRLGEGGGAGLRIADLGCGPGNSTALLVERFPQAEVTGFDTSETMLEAARARLPGARFERADIGAFAPAEPFDLVFSNAALQWVLGHERLIPALFSQVRPGGLLAAQIPDNLADPSQVAMRDIAAEAPFAAISAVATRRARRSPRGRPITTGWRRARRRSMSGPRSTTIRWNRRRRSPTGSPPPG